MGVLIAVLVPIAKVVKWLGMENQPTVSNASVVWSRNGRIRPSA